MARHPLTHCFSQLVTKDADQYLKQRLALPGQIGDGAKVDPEVQCNCEHVHQSLSNRCVLVIGRARCNLNLRQDFQAHLARSQYADHATRPQGMAAMFQHAAAAASGKGRAGRQGYQPVGMPLRDLVLALAVDDLVPLADSIGGHHAAKSEKSKLAFTLQRSLSPPSSSFAKPGGAVSLRASRKCEAFVPSASPSTAATFDQSS